MRRVLTGEPRADRGVSAAPPQHLRQPHHVPAHRRAASAPRSGRPRTAKPLVVWTRADSGKVKRLRHTPRVTVAPCDVRGRTTRARRRRASAEFVPAPDAPRRSRHSDAPTG